MVLTSDFALGVLDSIHDRAPCGVTFLAHTKSLILENLTLLLGDCEGVGGVTIVASLWGRPTPIYLFQVNRLMKG